MALESVRERTLCVQQRDGDRGSVGLGTFGSLQNRPRSSRGLPRLHGKWVPRVSARGEPGGVSYGRVVKAWEGCLGGMEVGGDEGG
jgi:hypothetical protein